MEFLADVGVLVQGGITGFQVFVMMNIQSLKKEIEEEKQHNINLSKRLESLKEKHEQKLHILEEKNSKKLEELEKEHNYRIKQVELMASKYWSKFTQ